MQIFRVFAFFIAISGLSLSVTAAPVTYDGILFPDGDISFADVVVSYAPGANVASPHDDPSAALGAPDWQSGGAGGYASLGNPQTGETFGGSIILQFTDNSLTPSGTSDADLHIFEIGQQVEEMEISISKDQQSWIVLGILEGQPTSIDIDAVAGVQPGDLFSFVRIIDAGENQSFSPFGGADIDAVGAISSSFEVPDIPGVPAPAALPLLAFGVAAAGLAKRSA